MYTLNCKGRLLVLDKPVAMGILNITPDSFYSGSRIEQSEVLTKAEQMISEGATILDIGGQSTRPGSDRLTADEELKRVLPAIEAIKKEFPSVFLSIDTYHAKVAKETVTTGIDIVNDISAGELDASMLSTVASLKVPFIAMHMQGTPNTMQQNPSYENITREVVDYFIQKTTACKAAGIVDLILDPGFGFGKTITHNFQLLKTMEALQIFHVPILAGLSRKSTIWKTLQVTPEEALNGTTVLNTLALTKGASILRVHDVKEAMETIKLFEAYTKA
ncbi:dihydropteroate synthase [Lacibacter sediminis]|uniref:dihydropteroate synthase n=1 Tax=Lacibacter sediminis TaxID=2760713 RepID=A0A7G5XLL2_9BACT|nr:dihydropteroate synthase [Lacibacter sediminis]QNA46365.1 dihydropteroate synthase [Lacibacter sediminis]